jgi:hypothetical protein
MDLEIKEKWFYSLIEKHGFEFGKKYQVIDVLNPERANEKYLKDFCTIVVDRQDDKGSSHFFSTQFQMMFSEKLEGLIPVILDKLMREKKEYDELKPQFEKITKKFKESEQKLEDLKNILTYTIKRTLTE